MSTKRFQAWYFVVSTKIGILGQLRILGEAGKVFHFIVVPCCHVPKPRDVDKKTPDWVFCGIDRAGYSGESCLFYSGPMLSCPEAKGCRQKDSKLGVLWYRQSWVFWGHWVFWGRMEKVFHFIVVPCCQGCPI